MKLGSEVSKYILPKLLVNTAENENIVTHHLSDLLSPLLKKFVLQEVRHQLPDCQLQPQMVHEMALKMVR